ncbi:hypothetical protein Tco_0071860, partial [Tanacetum coccineum]
MSNNLSGKQNNVGHNKYSSEAGVVGSLRMPMHEEEFGSTVKAFVKPRGVGSSVVYEGLGLRYGSVYHKDGQIFGNFILTVEDLNDGGGYVAAYLKHAEADSTRETQYKETSCSGIHKSNNRSKLQMDQGCDTSVFLKPREVMRSSKTTLPNESATLASAIRLNQPAFFCARIANVSAEKRFDCKQEDINIALLLLGLLWRVRLMYKYAAPSDVSTTANALNL